MICALNINMHAMNTCYNVGYGESISLNRLLLDISMLLRSKSKVYKIDERKGDVKHTKANLKKIKTLLGYYPTVSYSDGLKKLVTQNCLNPGI